MSKGAARRRDARLRAGGYRQWPGTGRPVSEPRAPRIYPAARSGVALACEYLLEDLDYRSCGVLGQMAVSVRMPFGEWVPYGACDAHEDVLQEDLAGFGAGGYTRLYRLDVAGDRSAAEAEAEAWVRRGSA